MVQSANCQLPIANCQLHTLPLVIPLQSLARGQSLADSRRGRGQRSRLRRVLRPGSTRGFTLVELLVVVIIIAVLAGLSAGAVVRYSNKARVSAAKAVVASAARECLRWMVDSEGQDFSRGTTPGEGLRLEPDDSTVCGGGTTFQVGIDAMPGAIYAVTVNSDGSLQRSCSGTDCDGGRW